MKLKVGGGLEVVGKVGKYLVQVGVVVVKL